ncbi:fructose PTS transporter subunit IIC [Haloferax volcanii]|uniref:PTS system fructose-specific EIIC component n=2 Tax=Haloferax volcanii TaxID=2246 RepID=PTFC_HALVD|nr:fructose PTS transporter subunit IIC [Haloferax volcanii]D4GYE5.1 RecName: Full=PTS system fructose-specific EIIC component; AltName: Full=EIIC-Fru; AltName: Full=Fructose permease IIC [Haloferax volcanii DS2]ADE05002.1 phosphotransferase system component IIC, fructose-specific [Haloferax volcanii DS2]ELY28263.1 Phosphotransferase system, EIIC [Haloferax volcanii DS2]MBS8117933.1 PTS fructose transporter subunit IIC [Haloferax volcanii]MBS8122945.1 PTS fructose transporter subunit IIC [Halo
MANDAEDAVRSYLTSVKEDLMTGVSFMIPFVTIGGIFLALGYAVASLSNNVQDVFNSTGTAGWFLAQIGVAGLTLMVPVLGAYIAYAIADRPGLAPGFILSYIIQQGNVLQAAGDVIGLQGGSAGAGYLGAIVAGFLAGIVARWFKQRDVPEFIAPMMPVLLIPVATTAVLTPVMLFVLGVPISIANAGLTEFLSNMQGGGQAILLGGILGAMMAADMGGPINKVAYVFSVGLISEGVTAPMAAVMIAGMVPPIGLALSNFIAPQKYAAEMYENAKSGVLLGFSFITEGAIPYAAADPARVIPSVVAGSAVAGAASMALGVNMPAPHGGIFVVPLSNQPFMFIACILLGSIVTAVIATAIKPNFDAKMAAQSSDD